MMRGVAAIGVLILGSAATAEPACTNATAAGVVCACDVGTLRPLQGAIGMDEVRAKADKIEAKPKKAWRDLEADPIKVVRGPGDALFITDHHHGADAWRIADHPVALCQIVGRPLFKDAAAFWQGLIDDRLVHLRDEDGQTLPPEELPSSLAGMPDDPYRSLAWRLRKARGFCRSAMVQKEFAEFVWADWLRTRPELPVAAVRASTAAMLPAALALARSAAAAGVPGYVGDKPLGFACSVEP